MVGRQIRERQIAIAAAQRHLLGFAFDEETGAFAYVQPADPRSPSSGEPIELAPEPSWGRVAYRR